MRLKVVSFASLCENMDEAAWEEFVVAGRSRQDGKQVRLAAWRLKGMWEETQTSCSRFASDAPL